MTAPLLSVRQLRVDYEVQLGGLFRGRGTLRAVNDVSFDMHRGETLGVVGESGCGKSSLARAILRLTPISGGQIFFDAEELSALAGAELRRTRRNLQAIFQDPLDSLDPRLSVAESVAEPLQVYESGSSTDERRRRVLRALEQVALGPEFAGRLPHELSGGQCQRVGIARAVVLHPKLIVCDEPVSALDVSIQEQTLELFTEIREKLGVALLFVSHNLAVVRQISHRVLVLYLGQVMELAARDDIFSRPLHPYTQTLLAAAPVPDPKKRRNPIRLAGEIPSPLQPPSGCPFRTRCPRATSLCASERPALTEKSPGHYVACHHVSMPERSQASALIPSTPESSVLR